MRESRDSEITFILVQPVLLFNFSEKNKKDKSSPQESPTKGATPKNGSKAPTGSHRRDESPSKGKPKKT